MCAERADARGVDGPSSPVRVLMIVLGLAALMATSPAFPLTPRVFDMVAAGVNVRTFTLAAAAGAVAAGILAVAAFLRRQSGGLPSARGCAVMCAAYVGVLLLGFVLMPAMGHIAVAVAFGLVLGVCMAGVFVAWGAALAVVGRAVTFGGVLAALCAAMVLATLGNIAFVGLPPAAVTPCVVVLALLAGAVPIAARARAGEGREDAQTASVRELLGMVLGLPAADQVDRTGDEGSSARSGSAAGLAVRVALPVAVLLLYMASQLVTNSLEGHHDLVTWSVLVAPIVVLATLLVRDDARRVRFALRTLLPLVGVVVMGVALAMPASVQAGVAALGGQALCYMYGLVLLALVAYFSLARFPQALVPSCGVAIAVLAVVMALPHLTRDLARTDVALSVFVAVLVVALCLLSASPSLASWDGAFSVARASAQGRTLSQNIAAACDAMADAYALSPREREVLHYLGRGYGPRYLATVLPIKENTIRSHVRNIYTKTDVHTQPELLELIDTFAER